MRLFSVAGGMRMIPELFQVIAKSEQLLALLGSEVWGQSAGVFQTLLQPRDVG
jgi:hypothetical protein